MARSGKVGIDYFSHDVDMMQDTKMKIIKAKHGLIGYAVYLRLLEELYRENGYYLHLTQDFNILFSDDNNLELNAYILILNDCIEKKLFDKKVYEKYSVITSERIQKNYCDVASRRKEVNFIKNYLLIDVKLIIPSKVNVNILPLNVDINTQNADIGTQSKVKERKGKERKEVVPEPAPPKKPRKRKITGKSTPTWLAYSEAYLKRYGVEQKRSAKASSQCLDMCKRVGEEDAPKVAEFYFQSANQYYNTRYHPLDLLVKDCETIKAEMIALNRRRIPTDIPELPSKRPDVLF